jgi:3-oxoadipate enol-lactonase
MTMQTVHELHRPDATIRSWVSGSPASSRRPTVVLLHGATLDHRAWDRQVDVLQDRFRLVVPDLRAHGESTGSFDFAAAVDDVRALLEALPTEDPILVGLSLGANIAQELVRQDHGRIRALFLADATCNTAARHPLSARLSVAALHWQALITGPGFAQRAARTIARDSRAQEYVLAANGRRTSVETVAILSSLLLNGLRSDPTYRLPVPTLLVHGEFDRVGDISTATRTWAQREELAEYAVIPDAGHASNLDNPAAFTNVLGQFLHRVTQPVDETAT